jgi:L-seryl-tRNA(Ser) seleniumtransferase
VLIAATHAAMSAVQLEARLRRSDPHVIARIDNQRVVLDLRTVLPEQDADLLAALNAL